MLSAHHLELAAALKLRGDGPADLEETFGLRTAHVDVGGVAGEDVSSADGEVELGRGVGREVHCGVFKKLVLYCFLGHTLLFLWAAAPSALKLARARSSALHRSSGSSSPPTHAFFRGISSSDQL